MFQTAGWNNTIWLDRLKKVACWWTSIVVLLFMVQAVVFTVNASKGYYYTNGELKAQYAESYQKEMQNEMMELQQQYMTAQQNSDFATMQQLEAQARELQGKFQNQMETLNKLGETFKAKAEEAPAVVEEEVTEEAAVVETEAQAAEDTTNVTNE